MPKWRHDSPEEKPPATAVVRAFWEQNPVAAASIAARPGSRGFFDAFDALRETLEPTRIREQVYAFAQCRGKAVLEVGCGNGFILARYVRGGAHAVGLDLTWSAVDLSRQRFRLDGLPHRLVQGDGERLPFGDASFDLVISVGVLHHTPDTRAAIGEIHRVLRPGGTFILMLYHRNSLHFRLIYPLYGLLHPAFRGYRPAEIARRIDGPENPIGRTYSRREIRELLAAFRDVRLWVGCLPIRPLQRLPGSRACLELLSRWVGWFLYARAQKLANGPVGPLP